MNINNILKNIIRKIYSRKHLFLKKEKSEHIKKECSVINKIPSSSTPSPSKVKTYLIQLGNFKYNIEI